MSDNYIRDINMSEMEKINSKITRYGYRLELSPSGKRFILYQGDRKTNLKFNKLSRVKEIFRDCGCNL